MGMMICTTNDGSYMTNGTGMCESSQQFGRKANFMAADKAYVAPVAAMILVKPKICCVDSQEAVPLVLYDHSFIMHVIMPVTWPD